MSVYIIRSKDLSLHDIYIGSTKNMRKREITHKTNCYNENSRDYNIKVYKFIRDNGGWDNWEMVKIASVWYKATKSLKQIEQDYIDKYKPKLNSNRAYRSEEYYKEYKKQKVKEWFENNREYHIKYQNEYREKNKEVLKEKKKEYYHKNIDRLTEYLKEWREKNKEVLKEKNYEKFTCECGGRYIKQNEARHLRSNKHKSFIENN